MFVAVVVGGSWGTNLAVGAVRLPALVSRQRHRPPGRNHVAIRLSNVLMSGQLNQHCPNPSNPPMVILWEGSNQFDDLHILKCIFYLIQKGEVVCGAIQCPVAPCRNPVLGPADCCPTCLSNVPFNLNLLIPHHLHQSSSSPRNRSYFFSVDSAARWPTLLAARWRTDLFFSCFGNADYGWWSSPFVNNRIMIDIWEIRRESWNFKWQMNSYRVC